MSTQPGFGVGESAQQADMFQDHGATAFNVRPTPRWGERCSFCDQDAVASQDHEGRTTWVCEAHYVNAVAMVVGA